MKNIAILALSSFILIGCKPTTQDSKASSTLETQAVKEVAEKKETETAAPSTSVETASTEKKDVVHAIEKEKNNSSKEEKVVVPGLKK